MNPYLLIDLKNKFRGPTGWDSAESLFQFLLRLGLHKLVVKCALIAAKMVLHIWEEDKYVKLLSKEHQEAPRRAIEITELWLEGKASIEEVKEVQSAANDAAEVAADNAANAASSHAAHATHASYISFAAANAVAAADYAAAVFYIEWWMHCEPLIYNKLHEFIIKGEM